MRTAGWRSVVLGILTIVIFPKSALALDIVTVDDGLPLAQRILGPGVTLVGTPTYTGSPTASGIFSGGTAAGLGVESGIILTSGAALEAIGPNDNLPEEYAAGNTMDDMGIDLGLPGDPDLDGLSAYQTYDASVLEFDFETKVKCNLSFRYVFASEEYIDFVTTPFNDVFGLFLNGVNIGVVPGSDPPAPITINTVNPFSHPSFYVNNVDNNLGLDGAIHTVEYDGFTTVITAQYLNLPAGVHHMKIAVADASDGILDAAVFIEAGSFTAAELSVTGPAELAVDGLRWNPNPFTVTAYLQNNTEYTISGDSLTLDLSGAAGLAPATGETTTHGLPDVLPGGSIQTSWQVQANLAGTWEYRVRDTLRPDLVAALSTFVPDVTAECQPGAVLSCDSGQIGVCASGMRICGADGLWGGCAQTVQPAAEICADGQDNDCDGVTDQADSDCWECSPGMTQACATALPGLCASGMQICGADGLWGGCAQTVQPAAEICADGQDNDCDGVTDQADSDCRSEALDCSGAKPSRAMLWPPNMKFIPVTISGIGSPDDVPLLVTVSAITQDEPVGGKRGADASGVGTPIASLRADRLGTGRGGRVYGIAFSAESRNGARCEGKVSVCVPHDMARPLCIDDGQRYDSTVAP